MKKELLHYVAGLCQAASAALLAGAVIVPDMRASAISGAAAAAIIGAALVALKEKGGAA
jgi:hypothetical protein